jgi:hypothetical protein
MSRPVLRNALRWAALAVFVVSISAHGAWAGGGFYDGDLLKQINQYETRLLAENKACNKAAFDHDLRNLEVLAELQQAKVQQLNNQTSQSVRASDSFPGEDAIQREVDRQRHSNKTGFGQAYNDSVELNSDINYFKAMSWAHCQPPQTARAEAPPTVQAPAVQVAAADPNGAAVGPALPTASLVPPPPPRLELVGMPKPPPSFCSETDRVNFLANVFNPAAEQATANGSRSADHLAALGKSISDSKAAQDILDARAAFNAYQPQADAAYRFGQDIQTIRPQIMATPVKACGAPQQLASNSAPILPPGKGVGGAIPDTPLIDAIVPAGDKQGTGKFPLPPGHDLESFCPMDPTPITVGPNSKVGSGARTKDKLIKTGLGMLGGFLPGGGGGGGGSGASDGPQTLHCRIKDSEMTVFNDPASGVSLKVGAKRSGDVVTVFAGVGKSPDSGTFQSAFLQKDDGAEQGPKDVGICELWGEWSLTVSWTRETYVNDQLVSRQEGGWSKNGTFSLPGVLSADSPQGALWKRLGFSNASHGAREIAAQYRLPPSELKDGVRMILHVTRPGSDPVTTVPFALMMHEAPGGAITFDKAASDCAKAKEPVQQVATAEVTAPPPPTTMSREDFDKRIDEISKGSGPPGGYDYAKISTSTDGAGHVEDGKVSYFKNGFDLPIYEVTLDAAGQVTGTHAMPGAAIWQTLQGITPAGHHTDHFSYSYGPQGRYVDRVLIYDENGQLRADYRFGSDGVPTQGQTFGSDGKMTGGFAG